MARPTEPPVQRPGGTISDTVESHPAYGQIGASRVSGSAVLYGSDFRHQHFVTIRIHTSELHRGLSYDRHHPRTQLIEVALSEAQWATFVSSLNMGAGVPCTIEQREGVGTVPGIPAPPDRTAQFAGEMAQKSEKALRRLEQLGREIEGATISARTKQLLQGFLRSALQELTANTTFVADQFVEHMETVVEHAKIEIGAYLTAAVQRAGLDALQGARAPLALPIDIEADIEVVDEPPRVSDEFKDRPTDDELKGLWEGEKYRD